MHVCLIFTRYRVCSKRMLYKNRIIWSLNNGSSIPYHWPAAHGPVCIPMRSLSISSGRWRIVKRDTWSRRSRAILQISTMCRPSLGFGNPLTTTYASPIVSTWQNFQHLTLKTLHRCGLRCRMMFVRLSVAIRYCVKTANCIVELVSPSDSLSSLFSRY